MNCGGLHRRGGLNSVLAKPRYIVIEHVPARICRETGEQLFSPDKVSRIQAIAGAIAAKPHPGNTGVRVRRRRRVTDGIQKSTRGVESCAPRYPPTSSSAQREGQGGGAPAGRAVAAGRAEGANPFRISDLRSPACRPMRSARIPRLRDWRPARVGGATCPFATR